MQENQKHKYKIEKSSTIFWKAKLHGYGINNGGPANSKANSSYVI